MMNKDVYYKVSCCRNIIIKARSDRARRRGLYLQVMYAVNYVIFSYTSLHSQ